MGKNSTALAKPDEIQAQIVKAAEKIADLAEAQEDETLGENVMKLAFLVQPETKGIEGEQRATIPQVNIRQAMTRADSLPEETKLGQLYTTMADHLGDELIFIPVLTHDTRKKWDNESNIECMSLDGKVGNRYGECAKCPHGQYIEGQRMECSKGTTYFVVNESFSAIYKVDFLKTSAKAGRTIRRLSRPPALWARKFKLTTEKQKGNQGEYYTFEVRAGDKTSDEERAICDALYDFFKPNYELAQLRSKSYVSDGSAKAIDVPVDVDTSGDDVPDFSDSM